MATSAKAARINSAIKVIQRMQEGMTAVDACQEVGLPRSTFYDIVKKNPEALAEVQDLINYNQHEQLLMILTSRIHIFRKIIADGLADKTRLRDRMAILKMITKLFDELMADLETKYARQKKAKEYLSTMPQTKIIKSRLSYEE